jgi:hypothetical protein
VLNLFVLFGDRRTARRETPSPDFRVIAPIFADSQLSAKTNRAARSPARWESSRAVPSRAVPGYAAHDLVGCEADIRPPCSIASSARAIRRMNLLRRPSIYQRDC